MAEQKVPRSIKVISALLILGAIIQVGIGILFSDTIFGVSVLIMGVFQVFIAYHLYRLEKWAFVAAMIIAGIMILGGVASIFMRYQPNMVGHMILGAAVVFDLYRNRELFL